MPSPERVEQARRNYEAQQAQQAQLNAASSSVTGMPQLTGNPQQDMQNMMRAMQENPQLMEHARQRRMQMMGQGGGAGGYGMPTAPVVPASPPMATTPGPTPAMATTTQPVIGTSALPAEAQPVDTSRNDVAGAPALTGNPQLDMQNITRWLQSTPEGQAEMQRRFGVNPQQMAFPQAPDSSAATQGSAEVSDAAVAEAVSNPVIRAQFQKQLESMIAMGFCDEQKCLQALLKTNGNIDQALDRMLSDM
jgi:hypothetical protein